MKKIIFGLFIAMAMISCVKEEFSEADSGLKTLSANVENDIDTKVGFTDGEAAFFWTKGDKIGVTTTQSSTSFSLMNLDDEDAGKSSGSFTGSMAGNPQGYAIYPYISDTHSMSGNTLKYHMPSEYTYSKLDGTYANPVGNSHNAPMYGIIDNGNVAFKHLGGVIAFQINELQGNTAYTFKLTADKQISGDFNVDLTAQTPQLVASDTDNASEKSVSVSFTTSKDQTSGYIYMPIPTGTFASLDIKVYQGVTEKVNTTLENKTINRKAIIRTTIGEQSLEGGEVNEVSSVEDVTKVLESVSESTEDVIVEVTEEVTGSQAIEIPAELETETTTIKFNEVANDATITINNENNGAYAGQIIIEIPAKATIPVIEANVPEGEVYIKQGNVTSLVVSSKENTTIIGAGVTVGTLTVKKGNVRIEKDGIVNTIKRSDNNIDKVTYVILEKDAKQPETVGEGINVVSNGEYNLIYAVANSNEFTLTEDIELTQPITIAKDKKFTLDLNGKTVVTAYEDEDAEKHYYAFDNKGKLTIKNTSGDGKIIARGNHNYGYLTLESGRIGACDGNGGYGIRNYNGSTFTMIGGSVITTLEDDHDVDKGGYDATPIRVDEGAKATISGGVVDNICDFTYALDNRGTTTIKGGTFTSIHTTIGNNGQLTIDGGSFKCNGLEGITAHVLYAAGGTATINGGTFDGKDNYNGFNVDAAKGATVNINGGKFLSVHSGSLYGEGTIEVAGGEFFDEVPAERLADGYEVTKGNNGNWVVSAKKPVAKIGEKYYNSLLDAINVVKGGETIMIAKDITDATGIAIDTKKTFTVDFGGHTYTLNKPGAGSTGTTTSGFQILQGQNVTFKNGTIKCSDDNAKVTWEANSAEKGIAMMIQNYADLTLENMTIDGTNIAHNGNNVRYIVSNNSGKVNFTGKTSITATGKDVAFDVYKDASYTAPVLTVSTTGTITGLVEVSGGTLNVEAGNFINEGGHCVKVVNGTANFKGGEFTAQEVAVFNMAGAVNITNGTFTSNDNAVISGNGTNDNKYKGGEINISGGTFNANIQTNGYVACGIYHPQKGTLKVTGGTFNIENGCGILMRGGTLDMTNSSATFNFTGENNTTGQVGDSRVVVPCGKKIVKDAYSAYYDAENIKITGVENSDIADITASN